MTIVYGYDFSEASMEALPAAASLASAFGTRLLIVHVADPRLRTLSPELEEALARATRQKLETLAAELRHDFPRLEVRAVQVLGHPVEELQAAAVREGAALLVVASGGSADSRERLGGVTERLGSRSEVPVLIIREAAPWLAWARGERRLRAVLGLSRDASSGAAVEMATRLRNAASCDVVVTEVYFTPQMAALYGLRPPPGPLPDPEIEQLVARDLGKRVANLGGNGDLRVRPSLAIGRPAEPLLDLAERERADLVIVGRHPVSPPFGIGSVSKGVLHGGRMSVLIVPASTRASGAVEPPRFDHILVATDLTRFGNQVLPHALALAAAAQASLTVLHVADTQILQDEERGGLVAKLRSLIPERWPLPVRTEVVSSADPSASITAAAERIDADVICLASHGRKGLARAALGSVTEEVMRLTRKPVLVVRPTEP